MEKSKWCDVCQRSKCEKGGVSDMEDMRPACYVAVKMVKFLDNYVPKELCTIDRFGHADDCFPCSDSCNQESCDKCIVTKVFDEYARLTNQICEKSE